MPKKRKTQKVRFHKGDKRPGGNVIKKLNYTTSPIKRKSKIIWQVHESPTDRIVGEYFFEEDAQHLCDFQNKNQVWLVNGGIPSFLHNTNKVV